MRRAVAVFAAVLASTFVATAGDATYPAASVVHPELWPIGSKFPDQNPAIEAFIADLLSRLTIEEKVGQVIQADLSTVSPEDLARYPLGSILNGGGSGPNGNDRAPPAEWLALADAFYDATKARGGTYVPLLWGTDAVHGHNNIVGATIFPHNGGLGAMRNPDLVRRIGEATSVEVRVTGQDWTFAPVVAAARDDRWGRTYESYSEDPEIVAEYAAAMVTGLQGEVGGAGFLGPGHIVATAKHFLGDGGTADGRDQGETVASEEDLRDIHAAGYIAAIEAGAQTVMASYSSWRGQKMHTNRLLLTEVLKGRMNFDGFVVGDWDGHAQVPGCTAAACPAAFNAGVDMFMAPERWGELFANTLAEVRSGEIPLDRLDDAVRRILRVKARAKLFDAPRPSSRPYAGQFELLGSPEHRSLAREAVRQSLVLLKNNRALLPLRPDIDVLVAGSAADNIGWQCGGWTISWQGIGTTKVDFPGGQTIFAGIAETVEESGGTAVLKPDGAFSERPDVAIVVFGERPYAEFRGDLGTTSYGVGYPRDVQLLRRLKSAGIPVVSVFLSGRPLWINPELNASDAFVAAWLPGTEGGGIADVIFARPDGSVAHDFTGKLAFSWPRTPDQVVNRNDARHDPLFPYGYGLSYADPRDLGRLPE